MRNREVFIGLVAHQQKEFSVSIKNISRSEISKSSNQKKSEQLPEFKISSCLYNVLVLGAAI
jgi:hypothetical protein